MTASTRRRVGTRSGWLPQPPLHSSGRPGRAGFDQPGGGRSPATSARIGCQFAPTDREIYFEGEKVWRAFGGREVLGPRLFHSPVRSRWRGPMRQYMHPASFDARALPNRSSSAGQDFEGRGLTVRFTAVGCAVGSTDAWPLILPWPESSDRPGCYGSSTVLPVVARDSTAWWAASARGGAARSRSELDASCLLERSLRIMAIASADQTGRRLLGRRDCWPTSSRRAAVSIDLRSSHWVPLHRLWWWCPGTKFEWLVEGQPAVVEDRPGLSPRRFCRLLVAR
jgi:hypothetical protein